MMQLAKMVYMMRTMLFHIKQITRMRHTQAQVHYVCGEQYDVEQAAQGVQGVYGIYGVYYDYDENEHHVQVVYAVYDARCMMLNIQKVTMKMHMVRMVYIVDMMQNMQNTVIMNALYVACVLNYAGHDNDVYDANRCVCPS